MRRYHLLRTLPGNPQENPEMVQSAKRRRITAPTDQKSLLFRFPFLLPLVAQYLSDEDVLIGLLATTSAMCRQLTGYHVKCELDWLDCDVITKEDRYISVKITRISGVGNEDGLSRLTSPLHSEYFNSLLSVSFSTTSELPISRGVFPVSLTELVLSHRFNHPLVPDTFPDLLQTLSLGIDFNQPLGVGVLPDSLTSLVFSVRFNQPIEHNVLPPRLQKLRLRDYFNQALDVGVLPSTLKEISFGWLYDKLLEPGAIPASVETVVYNGKSAVPLQSGTLPSGLKRLIISNAFAHPLAPGCLPDTLEHLELGTGCHQPMHGSLPASLKHLKFDGQIVEPVELGMLSHALEYLEISQPIVHSISLGVLPLTLKTLRLSGPAQLLDRGVLPPQLTQLCLALQYAGVQMQIDNVVDIDKVLHPGVLPVTLRVLELSGDFDYHLAPGAIPAGVVELTLGPSFGQRLVPGGSCKWLQADSIPRSVTRLTLHALVCPGIIPNSVTHLRFLFTSDPAAPISCQLYDESCRADIVPDSVTHLVFGEKVEQHDALYLLSSNVVNVEGYFSSFAVLQEMPSSVREVLIPTSSMFEKVKCPGWWFQISHGYILW